MVEYGVPHATFVVIGTILSEVDSTPIQSIRVVMEHDTVYTDPSGRYRVENSGFPDNNTLLVQFEDTDGATNGSYNPLDTIVEFKDPQFSGGSGSWDAGTTGKEVDVELKQKK
jgi:putative lipoprotein (rSAM/lipoprotein system)